MKKAKKLLTKDGLCYRLVIPLFLAGVIGGNAIGVNIFLRMEGKSFLYSLFIFVGYLTAMTICLWIGFKKLTRYMDCIYEEYKEKERNKTKEVRYGDIRCVEKKGR